MPFFYALVDAMAGREAEVEKSLAATPKVLASIRCKAANHDFLIKVEAASFDVVDDLLATHVRRIPGVGGIEVITDWDDHLQVVRDAKTKLG